jgi:hypothetical protein
MCSRTRQLRLGAFGIGAALHVDSVIDSDLDDIGLTGPFWRFG